MNPHKISRTPLKDSGFAPHIVKDYLNASEQLSAFYSYAPDIQGLKKALKDRQDFPVNKDKLVKALENQYKRMEPGFLDNPENEFVSANVSKLSNKNTFTVTTGHQPLLLGGPLYFLYKIIAAVNLAEALEKECPDFNIVPVLWLATEDHDFEEISQAWLFGENLQWETEADNMPVGTLNPSSILPVLDKLKPKLDQTRNGRFICNLFYKAYQDHDTFADATRYWVNRIFRAEGLLILDPMDENLKAELSDVARKDILEKSIFPEVMSAKKAIEKNYKAPVNPREINFFFFNEGKRERIIHNGEQFELEKSKKRISESEMQEIIDDQPQLLSPNVVTRPMMQEIILPNVAYVGGPAETAYWMELRPAFNSADVFFPALIPRSSVIWIGKKITKVLNKLQLKPEFLLNDRDELVKGFLEQKEEGGEIESEVSVQENSFDSLKNIASSQPPEIQKVILDYAVKESKMLEKFKKDLRKAIKDRNETELNQLLKVYDRLFPHGVPQERVDNFIPYYINDGMNFFSVLMDNINPLQAEVIIHSEA